MNSKRKKKQRGTAIFQQSSPSADPPIKLSSAGNNDPNDPIICNLLPSFQSQSTSGIPQRILPNRNDVSKSQVRPMLENR